MCLFVPSLCRCMNACSTDLMNLASSRIWMPSVPTKFQGTVRTALSASSSVVTMMCLTSLPLVNRNSTRQIQMLTTARLYCKKASMTGHWTPTALHVRNGEKRMSSALMCIVMRQASMSMCRPCFVYSLPFLRTAYNDSMLSR